LRGGRCLGAAESEVCSAPLAQNKVGSTCVILRRRFISRSISNSIPLLLSCAEVYIKRLAGGCGLSSQLDGRGSLEIATDGEHQTARSQFSWMFGSICMIPLVQRVIHFEQVVACLTAADVSDPSPRGRGQRPGESGPIRARAGMSSG
jgi:hypothetical protein